MLHAEAPQQRDPQHAVQSMECWEDRSSATTRTPGLPWSSDVGCVHVSRFEALGGVRDKLLRRTWPQRGMKSKKRRTPTRFRCHVGKHGAHGVKCEGPCFEASCDRTKNIFGYTQGYFLHNYIQKRCDRQWATAEACETISLSGKRLELVPCTSSMCRYVQHTKAKVRELMDIPKDMCCPITWNIMKEPVLAQDVFFFFFFLIQGIQVRD